MKKNGFTLVELLAVIIIIGLIFLLAVTNVIPVFRKSKTKGFINDAITLAEAARIKYKDDILTGVDDDLFAGSISGKKCYSIEDDLIGTYASNLNTRLRGSIEVCYGSSCTYDTKVWLTNGDMFIDGDIIDENNNNNTSLIKGSFTSTDYLSCGVDLPESNITYTFTSTGSIKSLTIPETGTYRLEVWGAQGGQAICNGKLCTVGGYGGYSSGDIILHKNQTLYISVGGKGADGTLNDCASGGYNGGGLGTNDGESCTNPKDDEASGGGGGATHIATATGLLSSLSDNKSAVIIVAGGGGGASYKYKAGSGGGYIGGINSTTNSIAANQTTGYAFGNGQDAFGYADSDGVGGGGGGYFGGYANNVKYKSSGAGGSGYIGNTNLTNKSMYCFDCQEALNLPDDEAIFTVSTTGTSAYKNTGECPDGYSLEPVSKCAKAGDGYVRITRLP